MKVHELKKIIQDLPDDMDVEIRISTGGDYLGPYDIFDAAVETRKIGIMTSNPRDYTSLVIEA